MRDTWIRCSGQEVWVDFRYENFGTFCFYCGRIGNVERSCRERTSDAKQGRISEGQYGEWLKADLRGIGSKQRYQRQPTERSDSVKRQVECSGGVEGHSREFLRSVMQGNIQEMDQPETSAAILKDSVGLLAKGQEVRGLPDVHEALPVWSLSGISDMGADNVSPLNVQAQVNQMYGPRGGTKL